jgi:hypothetical protein
MFVLSQCVSLRSEFRVCYDLRIKRCSVLLYLQLFVGGLMSYLRYLCLFAYSGVTHILGFFVLCFFVFVYPVLPVSLDCPFVCAPSVFSNVYFDCTLTRIHQFTTAARNFQIKLVFNQYNLFSRQIIWQ